MHAPVMPQTLHTYVCTSCYISFNTRKPYLGNSKNILCYYCKDARNNSKYFHCNDCKIVVRFFTDQIPYNYLMGKRAYCMVCIQQFYYTPFTNQCELCKMPYVSDYTPINNNNICFKCRKGCTFCHIKNVKFLRFDAASNLVGNVLDLTPICFCNSCLCKSRIPS
jgi:hypothetical protein